MECQFPRGVEETSRWSGGGECEGCRAGYLHGFRAGKACAMAATDSSMVQIPEACDWRTMSVLNYLLQGTVDEIQLLSCTLEQSDAEEAEL